MSINFLVWTIQWTEIIILQFVCPWKNMKRPPSNDTVKVSLFQNLFLVSSILPKNELKNFNFCPSLLRQKFFDHFWKNWKKSRNPFEINWSSFSVVPWWTNQPKNNITAKYSFHFLLYLWCIALLLASVDFASFWCCDAFPYGLMMMILTFADPNYNSGERNS